MNFQRNADKEKLSRRELTFASFDQVLAEVRFLSRVGYHRVGKWTLGQTCEHLARFMDYSLDGFPPTPFYAALIRPVARMMYLGKILKQQRLPAGVSTLPTLVPGEWADDDLAVAQLTSAINRVQAPDAEFQPSPLFGKLTPEQWRKVHLWHCQHHLEFLIPAAKDAQAESSVPSSSRGETHSPQPE